MKNLVYNKWRTDIKQILYITVSWMLISTGIAFYDYSVMSSTYVYFSNITLEDLLITQLVAALMAGLMAGTIMVKFWLKWIRTQPYGQAILAIVFVYSLTCFFVSFLAGCYFFSLQIAEPLYSAEVLRRVYGFIFGHEFLRIYFTWLVIALMTIVALLLNDKYGPGVFVDFLLGKYFRPRRVERIFMFLDLRSSTTIAEQLGERRYFTFLQEVFTDVTPAILYTQGEIYQYVGDEIIVSWKMKKGLENSRCINCFLELEQLLDQKGGYYLQHYGIVPKFKAGLHFGYVMAGEIGIIKREITFLGDVLNTTARIQGKCNELGVNILFSHLLSEKLKLMNRKFFPRQMGGILLDGKREKLELCTVG